MVGQSVGRAGRVFTSTSVVVYCFGTTVTFLIMIGMAISVVEFQSRGYKIWYIFWLKCTYSIENSVWPEKLFGKFGFSTSNFAVFKSQKHFKT